MINNHLSLLLLGWTFATSLAVPMARGVPGLEDHGSTTYDPNSGLEWLDLSLTAGQSYSSVLSGWNGYTTTQGFRFATRDEVAQLFLDVGASYLGISPQPGPVDLQNLQAASLALSLLGTTDQQSGSGKSWMFYDPSTEPALPSSDHAPAAIFGVGVVYRGYDEEGYFLLPGSFPTQDYINPIVASALVRAVPEASPVTLLGLGLGLALLGRSPRVRRLLTTRRTPSLQRRAGCASCLHLCSVARRR